jgi:hypothetical protein
VTSPKFISCQHQLNQFASYLRLSNLSSIHHSGLGCTEPSHLRFQTGANNGAVSSSDRTCEALPPRTAPGQGASIIWAGLSTPFFSRVCQTSLWSQTSICRLGSRLKSVLSSRTERGPLLVIPHTIYNEG